MKTHALRNLLVVASFAAFAAGCGPSWTVVKQANPNAFSGKKAYTVEPLSFQGVLIGGVDTEDAWIAKRKPEKQAEFRASYEQDKVDATQKFDERLKANLDKAGYAAGADVTVRPHVTSYEPGFWSPAGWGNKNTELTVNVDFVDAAGNVQDTIIFSSKIAPGTFNPATGQRVRQAANKLADEVAQYVTARTK